MRRYTRMRMRLRTPSAHAVPALKLLSSFLRENDSLISDRRKTSYIVLQSQIPLNLILQRYIRISEIWSHSYKQIRFLDLIVS